MKNTNKAHPTILTREEKQLLQEYLLKIAITRKGTPKYLASKHLKKL